ncbi:MAG: MATE family efflux transporter [bacterium]|nr:MATE family efflux transporter [bacterium]
MTDRSGLLRQASEPAVRGRLPLEELAPDTGRLRRTILQLAWPVAAEMLLGTLTQVVDMMMVARLGHNAIAAVGLSFRPMFFALSIFLGLGAGTTALVARSMGRKDPGFANRIAHQALMATAILASGLAALFYALAPRIQAFMGAAPDVLPLGVAYLRPLAWGMAFMYTSIVITAALRGAGDTMTSMRVNLLANFLNVLLNYTLIFGHFGFPALGVQGAGIATSVARVVAALVLLGLLLGRRLVILPPPRLLRFEPDVFLRVIRIGGPATLERVLMSLAMLFHLRMVAGQGTVALAAATLSQNIEELSYMPAIGVAVSAATLVGQFLGHGRPDAAERAGWECVRLALFFMGFMGLLFVLAPGLWLALYAPGSELRPLATTLLRLMGVAQPFVAVAFALSGGLRGAGDTASVMAATALSMWGVRLSLTYLFMSGLGWGAPGAWLAIVVDSATRAAIMAWLFARGRWRRIEL